MLKWTTDLPTEPGVYFMTNEPAGFNDLDSSPERRELVPVRRITDYTGQTDLEYWCQGVDEYQTLCPKAFPDSADGQPFQFFGPIPLPQPLALLKDGNGEVIDWLQVNDEEAEEARKAIFDDIDVRR